MSNDRELLELAAKAVDIEGVYKAGNKDVYQGIEHGSGYLTDRWCPLDDDGDALRLAVKLKLQVLTGQGPVGDITWVRAPEELDLEGPSERHGSDACAATRRAIVRAAAEIGRGM